MERNDADAIQEWICTQQEHEFLLSLHVVRSVVAGIILPYLLEEVGAHKSSFRRYFNLACRALNDSSLLRVFVPGLKRYKNSGIRRVGLGISREPRVRRRRGPRAKPRRIDLYVEFVDPMDGVAKTHLWVANVENHVDPTVGLGKIHWWAARVEAPPSGSATLVTQAFWKEQQQQQPVPGAPVLLFPPTDNGSSQELLINIDAFSAVRKWQCHTRWYALPDRNKFHRPRAWDHGFPCSRPDDFWAQA